MSNSSSPSSAPASPAQPDIASLLHELADSDQSTAAFARAHGLPPWKLYQALRQQGRKSERQKRSRARPSGNLVPVRLAPASHQASAIELVTPGGLRLCVPADFDESHLRRLLGVLGGC